MSVTLSPGDKFSLQELTNIYNLTRVDYLVPMPMSTARMQEYITTYDIDLAGSVVAFDEGEPVGLCMLGVRPGRAWITRLGVLPTTRRNGAGGRMMSHCIEQASLKGLDVIYLEVITGNAPAYHMFRKLGFEEIRTLLILRRPPGSPAGNLSGEASKLSWLEGEEAVKLTAFRSWRPAWTNQTESLQNAGGINALHLIDHISETSGWITYQTSPLQLKRVILSPTPEARMPPALQLLAALHNRFPTLDTIAENVPATVPFLDAYKQIGYVESFSRVEMHLPLNNA